MKIQPAKQPFRFVGLFCGGGGSITGAIDALNAAAPELYDMLEELADECYQLGGDSVSPLVDKARRLLAKARGEA